MARPPKGKPLTFRPLRLDDDVWAECQRLGKVHGTINEGLRVAFGWNDPDIKVAPAVQITDRLQRSVDEMINAKLVARQQRPFKGPIPRPKKLKR